MILDCSLLLFDKVFEAGPVQIYSGLVAVDLKASRKLGLLQRGGAFVGRRRGVAMGNGRRKQENQEKHSA